MKLGDTTLEKDGEQAHEALTMAGAEFLRKATTEQALNANLKAIAINRRAGRRSLQLPRIHTQRGQADRAINLLRRFRGQSRRRRMLTIWAALSDGRTDG